MPMTNLYAKDCIPRTSSTFDSPVDLDDASAFGQNHQLLLLPDHGVHFRHIGRMVGSFHLEPQFDQHRASVCMIAHVIAHQSGAPRRHEETSKTLAYPQSFDKTAGTVVLSMLLTETIHHSIHATMKDWRRMLEAAEPSVQGQEAVGAVRSRESRL